MGTYVVQNQTKPCMQLRQKKIIIEVDERVVLKKKTIFLKTPDTHTTVPS
jgi:hypothetical protein